MPRRSNRNTTTKKTINSIKPSKNEKKQSSRHKTATSNSKKSVKQNRVNSIKSNQNKKKQLCNNTISKSKKTKSIKQNKKVNVLCISK